MPWKWDGRGAKSVDEGGRVGTVPETAQSKSWPTYNAAYLASRLGGQKAKSAAEMDKYAAAGTMQNEAAQQVYLSKITENYKQEADECLKTEFTEWLQGKHDLNDAKVAYQNLPNAAKRRFVFRERNPRNANGGGIALDSEDELPGQEMQDWRPTWWGRGSLTHLPGVRDYLRSTAGPAMESELSLNVLAELGPQNIDQAWMYFKHWVKGRPLSEATCLHETEHYKDNQFDPSRTNMPSESFYPKRLETSHKPYKFGETSDIADSRPLQDGRPPQAIPRFCVGVEPCDKDDSSRTDTPMGTRVSSASGEKTPSPPPKLSAYSPFVQMDSDDPAIFMRPQARRAARSPVESEKEDDTSFFETAADYALNCVQFEQAKAAANVFEQKHNELEDEISELMIRHNVSEKGSEEQRNIEVALLAKVKDDITLNATIDEVNNTMFETSALADAGDKLNEIIDSASILPAALLQPLLHVDYEPRMHNASVRQILDGNTIPLTTPAGRPSLYWDTLIEGIDNTPKFLTAWPILLGAVAGTGFNLRRLNAKVTRCGPPISGLEQTYKSPERTRINLNDDFE